MIKTMINKGFTLLELMITIAILSILIAVATPSFTSMVLSNSVSSDQDRIFTLLISARSEAIKRGGVVSVCKSSDLDVCSDSAGTAWGDGVIVFFDVDGDGEVETADGDKILKVNEALDNNISLAFSAGDYLAFNSLGRAEVNNGTFTFSHSGGDAAYNRKITISFTGRVRKSD